MPYYVVNAGSGRSSTHIMNSARTRAPGLAGQVITGAVKVTLCGLTATRYVNVLNPSEASCRECRKRWRLQVNAVAAKTPEQRQREKTTAWIAAIVIFAATAAVTVYLVTQGHH